MNFETEFASSRQLVLGSSAGVCTRCSTAGKLAAEADERLELLLSSRPLPAASAAVNANARDRRRAGRRNRSNGKAETVIRPERFARLVTLAGMLIDSARNDRVLRTDDVCEELGITAKELAGDIDVLNVVNFGGGTYVLYAEVVGDVIEVDPEAYGDSFAKPARLLPLEAKALIAAIDFFGDHLPQEGLDTAREKIVAALGHDPSKEGLQITIERDEPEIVSAVNDAIAARQVLRIKYYKENEDEFTTREIEPTSSPWSPRAGTSGCAATRKHDDIRRCVDRTGGEGEPGIRSPIPAWRCAWGRSTSSTRAR